MRIGMVSATYDATVVNGAVRMVTLYKEHLEALDEGRLRIGATRFS